MKKHLLYLLAIPMMFATITKAKAQVNTQDSLALVDLYKSTGGKSWTNNTNWLTAAPVSTWFGIGVVNRNVGTIILQKNQLSGTIPSSIGNLINLSYLNLSENQLSSFIPSTIGDLTNLSSLLLFSNQLNGTIPSTIGNLKKLSYFVLTYTQISGTIPSSIGNLTNLQYLYLNNNYLTGTIPSSIVNLTNLQTLYLGFNQLTFDGIEAIATKTYTALGYAPQANIPLINTNNLLSVSVGGTPANNTFNWYKDGVLVATKVGDSTYTPTVSGKYWVVAINAVATRLTIYSDTITLPSNTWTGITSSDWFTPSNWTMGVPSSTIGAVIPVTSNQPIITNGNIASADSISIQRGAKLTNNGTLNVYGNISDTGRFISGSGSNVVLIDSGIISGADTFANLEIQGNYSVGASTSDKIYITGVLKKTSGKLTTNDKLTLVSNSTGSALIDDEGGALSGKAYIQHYAGGNFGYHHFSSPVSGATVNSWSNAFPIFGPDGSPAWLSNWGSLQFYNEVDNTTSLLDSSYYNYTALSNLLVSGKGYTAWLNSLPTLNTFGVPNNGTISIPVTHSSGTNDPKGWNLVGNPYPSPISWTALKALNPSLFGDQSCYLWKAAGVGTDGTWSTYDGTVGTGGAGDVINSSLGFFVYVNNSGTLNFDNSVRRYNYLSPEIFGKSGKEINSFRVSISEPFSKVKDEVVAYTSNKVSFSKKMSQPVGATNPTIAFDVMGAKAAINILNSIDSKTVLPLSVMTPKAGTYALSSNTSNIDFPIYLKDAANGIYIDLKANPTTTITTTTKESNGRYSVVFAKPTTNQTQLTLMPNPAKDIATINGNHIIQVQINTIVGKRVVAESFTDAKNPSIKVNALPAGVYVVTITTTDKKTQTIQLIKK